MSCVTAITKRIIGPSIFFEKKHRSKKIDPMKTLLSLCRVRLAKTRPEEATLASVPIEVIRAYIYPQIHAPHVQVQLIDIIKLGEEDDPLRFVARKRLRSRRYKLVLDHGMPLEKLRLEDIRRYVGGMLSVPPHALGCLLANTLEDGPLTDPVFILPTEGKNPEAFSSTLQDGALIYLWIATYGLLTPLF